MNSRDLEWDQNRECENDLNQNLNQNPQRTAIEIMVKRESPSAEGERIRSRPTRRPSRRNRVSRMYGTLKNRLFIRRKHACDLYL
ncbi:hypothetical protein EVAR_32280_1 [Eumeta japonica]|uniref:Uncharacterized protein n=1 Tax=Eumeta variegata TaxID=151549 RepID=A0A4C1WFP1_EUMVA|nr:hypothetical protein EVAR_32280_1 [Eumeta japonica]